MTSKLTSTTHRSKVVRKAKSATRDGSHFLNRMGLKPREDQLCLVNQERYGKDSKTTNKEKQQQQVGVSKNNDKARQSRAILDRMGNFIPARLRTETLLLSESLDPSLAGSLPVIE